MVVSGVAAALEHPQRAREHARRVACREADAPTAEVDAEHAAHSASPRPRVRPSASSASASSIAADVRAAAHREVGLLAGAAAERPRRVARDVGGRHAVARRGPW